MLAHGPVCKPFAHERWLIRHERWPKASCLRTDRWPTSARVGKPEGSCSQAATFMALQDEYSPYALLERLTEILEAFQAGDLDAIEDAREEFAELQYWINLAHFDRRAVNRRLRQYAAGDKAWQWA